MTGWARTGRTCPGTQVDRRDAGARSRTPSGEEEEDNDGCGFGGSRGFRPRRAVTTHVVLVHPEIHWNTGNAGRTCLAVGATLHLIAPLGFSLDEREVKRAGLDYWEHVDLRVWPSWDMFEAALPALGEPYFFSTKASRSFWDAPLGAPNAIVLIFGRETGGLPAVLHERYSDRFVGMPILSQRVRSLNLSTSVAIALYEVLRQRREMNKATDVLPESGSSSEKSL